MTYPHEPGWRDQETSRAAAAFVRPGAKTMIELVLQLLEEEGPASPEQLHAKLTARGVRSLLNSVRARVCQLHKQGWLVDTGDRALGESGRAKVIIWRLLTPQERAASHLDSRGRGGAANIQGD